MIRIVPCGICGKLKRENYLLLGRNICRKCEERLLQSSVGDFTYPAYLDRIKDVLKPAPTKR